jgi:small subunit ribosomal protein S5
MAKHHKRDRDNTEQEFTEQLINIRRVAKVVKGGRVFGFSALTVVGDGKGRIGMGRGNAREVPNAVQKSMENARQSMFKVKLDGTTIQYPTVGRFGAAHVVIRPASEGTGIIAGGTMRAVFEAVGVENILAKVIGTTNPINVTRATLEALKNMRGPEQIAAKRGINVEDL